MKPDPATPALKDLAPRLCPKCGKEVRAQFELDEARWVFYCRACGHLEMARRETAHGTE